MTVVVVVVVVAAAAAFENPILFSPVLGAADWRKERERERVATETKNKFLCARRRAHKTATSSSEKTSSECLSAMKPFSAQERSAFFYVVVLFQKGKHSSKIVYSYAIKYYTFLVKSLDFVSRKERSELCLCV